MKLSKDEIAAQIAKLGDLSRDELAERWTAIYGRPPPPGVQRHLLCLAVAWNLQAKHLGGLSAETRRRLEEAKSLYLSKSKGIEAGAVLGSEKGRSKEIRAASQLRKADPSPKTGCPARRPKKSPLGRGARLFRDWNGQTHIVDVTEKGFLYRGTVHRSLSAIARQITGAHWSGPRFFGL